MVQLGREVGRAKRRRLYRVQAVHTPAFSRRKPKQIKGMCGHVTAGRDGSQGPGSRAIGFRRWGGRPGSRSGGRRGFVGQVEGRWSRDQPIARADVVEKSAFLRPGVGFFVKSSRIRRNDGIFGAVNPPNVRSGGAARPGNVRFLGCGFSRQIP